ncbi:MAG: VOC family protein [Anaerolineae bacterium]
MFKRIDHIAFIVKDLAKSVRFYEDNLGFKLYFEQEVPVPAIRKIVYLRLGDTVLEMIHMPAGSALQGFHFCLESDDFEADYQRLKAAGVPIATEPHPAGEREPREKGWRRVVFSGPDGEQIEFRG